MPDVTREDLAGRYLEQLPFEPYPVQEEALLAWFTSEHGVLVCAPTGTGKTLIAEAAIFEALHLGKRVYYTTPLIALTDQKFRELQDTAERWGFARDQVGLATGNRRVNPEAPVQVVVAEILLNRLLHPTAFEFDDVGAVVMDEFHSFNDPERGIVWEFSLGLLPPHSRLLLLSATVGNAREFVHWLTTKHDRPVELVEGNERKVPLTYQWIGDQLLGEQIESMAQGETEAAFTPALVFCFNREMCWTLAEQLKGKNVLRRDKRPQLIEQLDLHDWSTGAGAKLRQILMRGVGVHHAGVMPRYRRIVESLFQQKLLSVAVCTETLSAGINLPARSVVIPNLLKGPPGKKKVLEPSAAHQMFGRAGRPQFDSQGFVFVMAHEDDVKIARWRVKYDQIPEDTKDPGLRTAKKKLKKKMPKRRSTEQYWDEGQFNKLREAPPAKLASRGDLPWRMLAYLLDASPDVNTVRQLVRKRLLHGKLVEQAQQSLDRMLLTLWRAGYVDLDPKPPKVIGDEPLETPYQAATATPTDAMGNLLKLRGVNPLYGMFLVNHMDIADPVERIQAMESLLEIPGSMAYHLRTPSHEECPPGPLAVTRLDPHLLQLGLATAEELGASSGDDEEEDDKDRRRGAFDEDRPFVLTLADKLRLAFQYDFPGVSVYIRPVWAAGELLEFGGDFDNYVKSKRLQKQEGVIFRHLMRLILLAYEFAPLTPPNWEADDWSHEMNSLAERLTDSCRRVDPDSTDRTLEDTRKDNSLDEGQ